MRNDIDIDTEICPWFKVMTWMKIIIILNILQIHWVILETIAIAFWLGKVKFLECVCVYLYVLYVYVCIQALCIILYIIIIIYIIIIMYNPL